MFLELAALIPIPEIHLHGFARTFQLPEISRCFRATDASGTLLLSETAVLVAEQHLGFERAQLGSPKTGDGWRIHSMQKDLNKKVIVVWARASEGRKLKSPAITSLLWACCLKTENRKANRSSFSAKYSAPLHNCVIKAFRPQENKCGQ